MTTEEHSAPKISAPFDRLMEEIGSQLVQAQSSFDIWQALWPTENVVDTVNAYRGFFIPTRDAHRDRFFTKAVTVAKPGRSAPSLHRLLEMIRKDGSLAPGVEAASLTARLRVLKPRVDKAESLRNRRAAHWDTEQQPDKVTLGEFRAFLTELQDVYNEVYSSRRPGAQLFFQMWEANDVRLVLETLAEHREGWT